MAGPAELVNDTFKLAKDYAAAATNQLDGFVDALNKAIYTPPTISVKWASIAAPALPARPSVPTMPTIQFQDPGNRPTALTEAPPNIQIDTFNEQAPELSMPVAPSVSYGVIPSVPSIGTVAVPDAPQTATPDLPALLALSPVSLPNVDLHADWLGRLEQVPTLELLEPTPYTYNRGPEYASLLLDNLRAKLNERMRGGSGLPAAVEQAIWDRARSREVQIARASEAEVMRNGEALGYEIPPGVVLAQLRDAQRATADKQSDLSRDIAIKQADLEQANMRDTITAGMQLEGQLIDQSLQLERLTFEAAKAAADNALQVQAARIQHFQALLQGYTAYAEAYKTIINGELAKVEIYKAQLAGEQAKADINKTLVEQYKAQIEAGMARVEIYRAQVSAAQTLVELEKAKVSAAGEQIRAYVAQVNAETAKVEAYKASVEAEATKLTVYKTKADVFSTRVQAQAEYSRAMISRYSAIVQAKAGEWDGYRARIQAEGTRLEALGRQSASLLDGYKAAAAASVAEAEMQTKVWESSMRQYEAAENITLQAARANNEAILMTNNARLDAAKAGTQTFAQLTSSSYSMMHTGASISSSGSTGVSYSYSGQVNGSPAAITAA